MIIHDKKVTNKITLNTPHIDFNSIAFAPL